MMGQETSGGTYFKEFECLLRYFLRKRDMMPEQPGQDLEINDDTFLFTAHNILCCFFKDPVAHDTCQIIGTVGQGITDLIGDKTELMVKRGKSSKQELCEEL